MARRTLKRCLGASSTVRATRCYRNRTVLNRTVQWAEDMLAFHEENFHYDEGIEVRSMDRRELEVKEEERRGGEKRCSGSGRIRNR